jgi:hypothetical protein
LLGASAEGGMTVTNVVFLAELLAERGAHDGTSDAGWGIEMSLSRLAPGGVEGCIQNQFCALGSSTAFVSESETICEIDG